MIADHVMVLRKVERWRGCGDGCRSLLALYRTAFEIFDSADRCVACSGRGVIAIGPMLGMCARCRGVGYRVRLEEL